MARNVKPSSEQSGLLGLGYSAEEASALNNGTRYPNFIETLVNAGEIASRFYSLYLSNIGQYGNIVFGGVDTKKFQGDLVTLNCLPRDGVINSFRLVMPNVTIVNENGTTTQLVNRTNAQFGFFDSGSSAWSVKDTIYNKIVDLTGFVSLPDGGAAICPCVEVLILPLSISSSEVIKGSTLLKLLCGCFSHRWYCRCLQIQDPIMVSQGNVSVCH